MKQDVLKILMELFEHFDQKTLEIPKKPLPVDLEKIIRDPLHQQLSELLTWLKLQHAQWQPSLSAINDSQGTRFFHPIEVEKFGNEGIAMLLSLEARGLIDKSTREMIFDLAFAMEDGAIAPHALRWLTVLVLISQNKQAAVATWLQENDLHQNQQIFH